MKIENLVLEIWLLITQVIKRYVRMSKNFVRRQLTQYSEHLPHSSEVWCSIPDVVVSKKPITPR